jgi:hypothetical protein
VEQFAGIDCLQVECCFTAWFESQNSLRKKPKRTVAVDAQSARTVYEVGSELQVQQPQQIRIGDLAVVSSPTRAGTFALDLDASQSSVAQKTVVARECQQSRDSRLR